MRVKEVARTSNITWSPDNVHPMYIAAGTSAKQLDASFSTSSCLELFEVDPSARGLDMPLRGSLNISSRFNALLWGNADREMGLIAGGGDNGTITLWDPSKIIGGAESAVECELPKHCGPVKSMDFNPSKKCLLASGSSASEIHIVDINKPETLMTPGPKAQPEDDVVNLAWNKQVEHILASAHPSSCRAIVWDLRKNEAIIQVMDSSNRLRCSCICWHPDVATQLITASEEDRYPVIQMWDLRFATSPTAVLEGHQRGIQSMSWCGRDSGLLLTSSRDDHMICWNPNSNTPGGEKLVEFNAPSQWTFDMSWCPRNPYLIGSSSFSGKLTVFSVFGGEEEKQAEQPAPVPTSNDPFAAPPPQPNQPMNIPPLTKAPKWLRRPCGVSFGFGGKLISFDSTSTQLTLTQVTTEPEILERSAKLEQALQDNSLLQFCADKADNAVEESEATIWGFLRSTFDAKPRQKFLELLGYRAEDLPGLVAAGVVEREVSPTDSMNELTLDSDTAFINKSDADSAEEDSDTPELKPAITEPAALIINTEQGVDGLICRAMLLGQFDTVVDLCLKAGRMADALAVAMAGGRELFQRTQQEYFKQAKSPSAALLCCIISQQWEQLVDTVQLDNWREALAILLSYAKPTEFNTLCDKLAARLVAAGGRDLEAAQCYVCSGNVTELLHCWEQDNTPATPLQLQDLMEKIMCLQSTSSVNTPLAGDTVVKNVLQYSKLLAGQGKLANALTYINATSQDTAKEFKYALHMALRDPSLPTPPTPYVRPAMSTGATTAAPSVTSPTPSNYSAFSQYPPSQYSATPSGIFTPAPLSYQAPSMVSQPAYQAPAQPAYQAPSQPPSIASQPISNVSYQPTPYTPQPVAYQPPTSQYEAAKPASPITPSYQPPGPPSFVGAPSSPGQGSFAGSEYSSVSQYNPGPAQYNQFTPQAPPSPPAASYVRPKGAWNDPPPMRKKTGPAAPAPQQITQPILPPAQNVDLGQQQYNQQYNQQQQQPAPAPTPPAPEPAYEPPPVPEACIPMITVLDGAVYECKNGTNNPTHKRKLDEVHSKIEALKDKLRYNALSDNVIDDLNHMAGALNVKDYNSALMVHTKMAQTANFSEVGSFLPGLKVLLQIGNQLAYQGQQQQQQQQQQQPMGQTQHF